MFIGVAGGAIVATPAVQGKMARYCANNLNTRLVLCEGDDDDLLISAEMNIVRQITWTNLPGRPKASRLYVLSQL